MAATLIYIKSKMLLPQDPELAEGAEEDRARSWWTGCSSARSSKRRRDAATETPDRGKRLV